VSLGGVARVGLLLNDGLVDADGLYDLIGSAVLFQWVKWEQLFKEYRVRYGLPETTNYSRISVMSH
jgi:hypothetical protein